MMGAFMGYFLINAPPFKISFLALILSHDWFSYSQRKSIEFLNTVHSVITTRISVMITAIGYPSCLQYGMVYLVVPIPPCLPSNLIQNSSLLTWVQIGLTNVQLLSLTVSIALMILCTHRAKSKMGKSQCVSIC